MYDASQKEDYEAAAGYRDQLQAIASLNTKQSVVLSPNDSIDVIAAYQDGKRACFYVLSLIDGKLLKQKSYLTNLSIQTLEEAYTEFIIQLYYQDSGLQEVVISKDIQIADILVPFFQKTFKRKVRGVNSPKRA